MSTLKNLEEGHVSTPMLWWVEVYLDVSQFHNAMESNDWERSHQKLSSLFDS